MTDSPDWMASYDVTVTIAESDDPAVAVGFDTAAVWLGRTNPETPATYGNHAPAPLLRRVFDVPGGVASATLLIASAGYYEAEINGLRVGDAVLDPPLSQFNKTIFSRSYDVTDLVNEGLNALGVILGRGFISGVSGPGAPWTTEPRLLAQVQVTLVDGSLLFVTSDDGWRIADSGTRDWIYYGTSHDARLDRPGWSTAAFDDSGWAAVVPQDWPTRRVIPAVAPPVRVVDTLAPVQTLHPIAGTVFDFGRITAGTARITVRGMAGTTLQISYGQQLDGEGHVALFAPTMHVDGYILSGEEPETWEPKFARHSFQYVEVVVTEGPPLAELRAVARESFTDVESTGTFETSNSLLNSIHQNQRRSLQQNHWGFPTDTAGRDRQGWTADTACYLDGAILNFAGLRDLYHDWFLSLRDTQQADGSVSIFAPDSYEFPIFNDPSWTGMLIMIPWTLYQHFGDESLLSDSYATMTRWLDLMDETIAATGDLYQGFSFGDHSPPEVEFDGTVAISPPEGSDVTRNAHLYLEARTLAKIARILEGEHAGARFDAMAERIFAAFGPAYYHPEITEYRTPTQDGFRQTSNILPLAFGLVPDELRNVVFERLVRDLEERGARLNTGSLGTKQLLPLLTREGRGDLAYRIAAQTEYPSWGYWVTQGATASWETWSNCGPEQTLDHPFLATVEDWLYQDLAGIQAARPGYAVARVSPLFPAELDSVAASVTTPHGIVSSSWIRDGAGIALTVTQPFGRTAEIVVPRPRDSITVVTGAVELVELIPAVDASVTTFTTASREVTLRFE